MAHISLVNHLLFKKSFTSYSSLQVPLLYFWLPVFLYTAVVRKQVGCCPIRKRDAAQYQSCSFLNIVQRGLVERSQTHAKKRLQICKGLLA